MLVDRMILIFFYAIFSDLDPGLGSQDQQKQNVFGSFWIQKSSIWIYVMSCVHLFGQTAV